MQWNRVIDLSHTLDPKTDVRLVRVERVALEDYPTVFPGYVVTKADENFPMHTVLIASHIGTHLETPYHWGLRGIDVAEIPVEQLIGEAVLLDLRHVKAEDWITKDDVMAAAAQAGMRRGDMVFCDTVYEHDQTKKAPFFRTDAIEWLVEQGMTVLGVEAEMEDLLQGAETGDFPNHTALFSKGVLLIEYITNLEALHGTRFTAIALPAKIRGADSLPIRLVALQ
jgi:arylformamidase